MQLLLLKEAAWVMTKLREGASSQQTNLGQGSFAISQGFMGTWLFLGNSIQELMLEAYARLLLKTSAITVKDLLRLDSIEGMNRPCLHKVSFVQLSYEGKWMLQCRLTC